MSSAEKIATSTLLLYELPLHERVLGSVLRSAAQQRGESIFLEFEDVSFTYAEFDRRTNAVAQALVSNGVAIGDRVVALLPNIPEFLTLWFGVAKAGATIVPINPDWKGDTLEYIVTNADPRLIVVTPETFWGVGHLLPDLPAVSGVVICGEDGESESVLSRSKLAVGWSEFVASGDSSDLRDRLVTHDAILAILYSSGTTGRPKGIVMSHAHIYSFARQWMRTVQLTQADVVYSPTPLFYMLASILGVVPTLLVTSRIRIAPRFSASRYWEDIRTSGATVAHSVFSIIPILLKQPPSARDREHNCRALYIAKSNAEFESRFGVRLIEIYGSTEMNIVAYNPWDAPKPGSCGKAAPNFEVKIVDENDVEVPHGAVGEIVARPREPFSISYGYWQRPDHTVDAWRNLWFHCGDRGYFDDDGYLFYVDRVKDVIRRGGENISSYELERNVNSHPSILESAAIPVPSDLGEDEVKICVVLQPDMSLRPDALIDYLVERVPRFMVPRFVEIISSMPRTGSLKIEKYKLRENALNANTFDRERGRDGVS